MNEKKKVEDKISLYNFKINNNIPEMEYVGLKIFLIAKSGEEMFKIDELEKARKKYNEKPAFV